MTRRLAFGAAALVALSLVGACAARAEDWPTYRHDRLRTAISSEKLAPPLVNVWMFRARGSSFAPKNMPSSSDRSQPPGLYANKHGAYFEMLPDQKYFTLPITAAGDSIFFTTANGRVVCLDAATAEKRWDFLTGAAISQTANVFGGKVYAGSDDGCVYCLDAKTGKLVWKHKAAPADRWFISFGRMASKWPVRTDVFVDKGAAYFAAGIFPHDGMFVNKIDAQAGNGIWQTPFAHNGLAGHIVLTTHKIHIPLDVKGFERYPVFRRSDGVNDGGGPDPEMVEVFRHRVDDSERGVVKDGIRYTGVEACKVEREHERGKKQTLYRTPMPTGRFPDQRTFVYAGGTLYFLANDSAMWGGKYPLRARGGAVFARDPKTGKDLWSFPIPERPHHIIVANGRLFVSTRGGTIYCFAPKGTAGSGVVAEDIEPEPFERNDLFNRVSGAAHHTTLVSGVKKGYVVVLDCESGAMPYALATQTDLYVCAVFRDAAKAQKARALYARANLHASRISVWHQKDGAKLPYPSKFADLIVSESAAGGGPMPTDLKEMGRLLKPIRGVAWLGGRQEKQALEQWMAEQNKVAGPAEKWQYYEKHGSRWVRRTRSALPGGTGWCGPGGGPERTNCSHDKALKGPLDVVWYGPPYVTGPVGRPPRIANGVMVCPTDLHSIEAYDQYNGRRLWKYTAKNLAGQFMNSGCVGGDYAFTAYYGRCLRLDLWNGGQPVDVTNPFPGSQWGGITLSRDGKMLWGSGYAKEWRGLFAIDVKTGRTLWKRGGPGKGMQWGSWNAIADGRMYIIGGKAEGERRQEAIDGMRAYLKTNDRARLDVFEKTLAKRQIRVLTALDAATGELLYRRGIDLTNRGQFYGAAGGRLVFGRVARRTGRALKIWGIQYRPRQGYGMAAFDGATGKLLWNELGDIRFQPVVTADTIYAEPWVVDAKTGKRRQRPHPISGKPADHVWIRIGKHCGGYNGSEYFIFGRNMGIGYHNMLNDSGMYTFMHSRSDCHPDSSSGGGMMIKPPMSFGCRCAWSLPFTVAMAQAETQPEIDFSYFGPGPALPVKHLRLNLGTAGDRRDAKGNLWLKAERRVVGHMREFEITHMPAMVFYPGADWSRRNVQQSAVHTRIENTDTPMLFATAKRGLKRCVLPVMTPADGKGTYVVRLGFSAPPGDKPGQRVFDVRLNGKRVLKDFDIVKDTGKTNCAIWKETTLELDGDLIIDLVAKEKKPSFDQMPLLNGLQILRKEITTLGLAAPAGVWLNQSNPERVIDVSVANLRAAPFKGTLVVEGPAGIKVAVDGGNALELPPGTRKKITVRLKAGEALKAKTHLLTVKIVAESGNAEMERTLAVEWLGSLERKVLRGGSRSIMPKSDRWRWLAQNTQHLWIKASKGGRKAGDGGSAYSLVWFGIPNEVGTIRRARLRLHTAQDAHLTHEVLFDAKSKPGWFSSSPWGSVKQVLGPPWPNLNALQYPARPKTLPKTSALRPTKWAPNIVEADVPGDLDQINKSRQVKLSIEPTALNGAIYWSTHQQVGSGAAVLLIDYEPKK